MAKAAEMNERMIALETRVDILEQIVKVLSTPKTNGNGHTKSFPTTNKGTTKVYDVEPSCDEDLDSQYGNPRVAFDPYGWKGETGVGLMFSQQTPEYLRAMSQSLANRVEYLASDRNPNRGTEQSEKRAFYASRDASRALGWALRLESATEAQEGMKEMTSENAAAFAEDENPF